MAIIVAVKYRLQPGKRDELLTFVSENVVNTRRELGNLAYTHYPSLEDDQEMFVFEMWEDLKNLDDHIRMPHYVSFSERRMPILESWEAQIYETRLIQEVKKAPLSN
jgi:quinol monooxygenase YgiN